MLLHAQNFQRELKGKVISDSLSVEGIHVINITSQSSTITNQSGNFQIQVRLNDTLLFSAVQYELKKVVVTQEAYNESAILVKLITRVNELSEVVVTPYNLSGNLAEDMKTINTDDVVNAATLGLPNARVPIITQSKRRLYEATTGGGIPLSPIINAITGRTKMLKNRIKLEGKEKELNTTMNSFEVDFYRDYFKIPEEYIKSFLYFCAADLKFESLQNDNLLLLEFFEVKAKEYRKINSLN